MSQPRASTPEELSASEAQLQRLSSRIDPVLRRHFATHAMCRLLSPPHTRRERGQRITLWAPSDWLLKTSAAILTITLLRMALPWLTKKFAPILGARILHAVPELSLTWACMAIAVLLVFERLALPRMLLSRHRFRLMRLEHNEGQQFEFPSVYCVARVQEGATGFGWQSWRMANSVQPGDIVISISDRNDRGVGLIQLRTKGRLPGIGWDRDIIIHNAFPPLPEDVRSLAHDFDLCCTRNTEIADKIERNRTLRSGNIAPKPKRDPRAAWADVVLADPIKTRLIALATHFDAGSAAATRGLLLYGPPGTGKSLIAKTFAASMECAFYPLSLTDLKGSHIGESGANVKQLWRKALGEPRAVIFIDECEGVFSRRGSTSTDSFAEEIVSAFLAQWDGFDKHTHVWVVGATNRREIIDSAILSRFEDQLEIGLPDGPQRMQILKHELIRVQSPSPLPPQTEALTHGMSGRELSTLAKNIARTYGAQHNGAMLQITDDMLGTLTASMRKQGSTATAADAHWDTLVLAEATLKELKTTAGLLQHAEAFGKRGIGVPRGLLLYGPPGTGKTQIARTLANETGLRFIAVTTADIKQSFIGGSGQKVREIFERARESAPSLLFIDEIDILASARGGQTDSFQTEIVGQLLQEMDGAKAQTQQVFVLAATNRVDQVDPAVLSRLPKQIEIPLPDTAAAQRMLEIMLRGKPLDFDARVVTRELAIRAAGKSGRDLRNWVEAAELKAVARAIEANDPDSIAIRAEDF